MVGGGLVRAFSRTHYNRCVFCNGAKPIMYEEVVCEGPWLFFAVKALPVLVLLIMVFPGAFAGCFIGANHLGGWGGPVAFALIMFGSPYLLAWMAHLLYRIPWPPYLRLRQQQLMQQLDLPCDDPRVARYNAYVAAQSYAGKRL